MSRGSGYYRYESQSRAYATIAIVDEITEYEFQEVLEDQSLLLPSSPSATNTLTLV